MVHECQLRQQERPKLAMRMVVYRQQWMEESTAAAAAANWSPASVRPADSTAVQSD